MAATSDSELADTNVLPIGIKSLPRVLRSAGIYGANASGKSNLIRALRMFQVMVTDSASLQPGQALNVQPFLLDPTLREVPSEFEATFLVDGVRYQYGFTANAKRFESEWLLVYQTIKPQTWFQREFDPAKQDYIYEIGNGLKGQREVWRESTRSNALFLSTAVQLNSESLRPIYDWIARSLVVIENGGEPLIEYTMNFMKQHGATNIQHFMANADIGISKIDLVEKPGVKQRLSIDGTGESRLETTHQSFTLPFFEHRVKDTVATFPFEDESRGSQRFFAYTGPLFEILEAGRTLIVDELDVSLHALLVREIVQMFHDPKLNKSGAQLVFSTHDTSLLQSSVLRRDQIWLVDKDADHASTLTPLSDYSVRKDAAIEKNYLSGRYGGVPILRKLAAGRA